MGQAQPASPEMAAESEETAYTSRLTDGIQWMALLPHLAGSVRLLDYGCVRGRFASRIASLGARYWNADREGKELHHARSSTRGLPDQIGFPNGGGLPYENKSFDTVLTCNVLQTLMTGPEIDRIISELHRVLIPGGKLVLLEEARLSGEAPDGDQRPCTESDYRAALAGRFEIRYFRRIRMARPSPASSFILRQAPRSPRLFESLLPWLCEREIRRAETASPHALADSRTHEIVIEAAARSPVPFLTSAVLWS